MSVLLDAITTKAIQAVPYVGQRVCIEGKTPGRVVVVGHAERLAAVRTDVGELVPIACALLHEEA